MDVMARSIYRSGNYQPELANAQAIFPDREYSVRLEHDPDAHLPIGKQKADFATQGQDI